MNWGGAFVMLGIIAVGLATLPPVGVIAAAGVTVWLAARRM